MAQVDGDKPRRFTHLQTFSHASTNWAPHRVTLLTETNRLPLSQAAIKVVYKVVQRAICNKSDTKEVEPCAIGQQSNGIIPCGSSDTTAILTSLPNESQASSHEHAGYGSSRNLVLVTKVPNVLGRM